MNKKLLILSTIGVLTLLLVVSVYRNISSNNLKQINQTSNPTITSVESKTFKYSGEEGRNALEILQSKTTIEQDNSDLVTSINNVKANPSAREYWAFYVNGEMAQVGPQDYVTKNTDKIEWKLETY